MKQKSVKCRLPDLLKIKGWSQQELATRLGGERQQVNDWCHNRSEMFWSSAWIVSKELGVSMEELYEWTDQPVLKRKKIRKKARE